MRRRAPQWRRSGGPAADEPRALQSSIGAYLVAEGLGDLDSFTRVQAAWDEIVGEQVARHALPESLRLGELRVRVDQPAWATEVRFIAAQVLAELEKRLGAGVITSLKVHVQA